MDTAAWSTENGTKTTRKVVETAGMIFPDGSALELVSTSADNKPRLLLWEAEKDPIIAAQFERDGTIYIPPSADASIWPEITLPTEVLSAGSAAELFSETAGLFETYSGMSSEEAAKLAVWNTTTWIGNILSDPVTLFIQGWDKNAAVSLLRLLSCTSRHALILTGLDRPSFRPLVKLQPTLLLNEPQMQPRLRALCRDSNYKGVVVPDSKGRVFNVACPKAIFVGTSQWAGSEPGIKLSLPPASTVCPIFDPATQLQIKQRFQPWYLAERLNNLKRERQSEFVGADLASPTAEILGMLQSRTGNRGALMQVWEPLLLEERGDVRRSFDPIAAATIVLWPRLHSSETSISMTELTRLTNAQLQSLGETREYSPQELGIKLTNEGLPRQRRNFGMVLFFDRPTQRRVHQLAHSLGVGKRMADCEDCREMEIAAE